MVLMILILWSFAILAWIIGVYIFAKGGNSMFRFLALAMISIGIYCGGYAGELSSSTLQGMIAWSKLQYIGIATMPAFWIEFVLRYTYKSVKFSKLINPFLWVVPLMTIAFRIADDKLGLIYTNCSIDPVFNTLTFTRGSWYYVNLAYMYGMGLMGFGIILIYGWRKKGVGRRNAFALVLFSLLPFCASLLNQTGHSPYGNLDIAPFALAGTITIIYLAVAHQKIIGLTPVANEFIFEKLPVAILVFNRSHHLCDANESARALLALGKDYEGKMVSEIFPTHIAARILPESGKTNFESEVNGREQDIRTYIIDRKSGTNLGWIVTMSDISERKRIQRRLEQLLSKKDSAQ